MNISPESVRFDDALWANLSDGRVAWVSTALTHTSAGLNAIFSAALGCQVMALQVCLTGLLVCYEWGMRLWVRIGRVPSGARLLSAC